MLAAYSTIRYLPCVVVREGYFNTEAFVQWVTEDLLSYCNVYPGLNSVLRDDRDRQIHFRIIIVLREYEVEMIALLSNEAVG